MLLDCRIVVVVVLSVCEYDMGIVDNLCSPGWEKDDNLTITVLSLDRKFEFKVAVSSNSFIILAQKNSWAR